MTNILYFTATEIIPDKFDGVAKKIIAQCEAFESLIGEGCVYISSFVEDGYTVQQMPLTGKRVHFDIGSASRLKMKLKAIYPQLLEFVIEKDVDSVYFRSPGLGLFSHQLFKGLRKAGVSVMVEIPTWPFWFEKRKQIEEAFARSMTDGIAKTVGAIDYWIESHRLAGLVDGVVTFSDEREIWGLPAFGISNGYDFRSAPRLKEREHDSELRFVTAATLRDNHGVDRMIRAIADYQGSVPVSFHIAGEGDASDELRSLAQELGVLNRSVFFYGYLYGADLIDLYSRCDVGVSALGFHRYGVMNCSPLKTKEYLALGLPCLGSDSEKDILDSPTAAYFFAISSDELPFDLGAAVGFFIDLKTNGVTREEVRAVSERVFDWKVIMKPIVDRFITLSHKGTIIGC